MTPTESKDTEVWVSAPGWEECYEVSSLGSVRRKGASVMNHMLKKDEGYHRVRLTDLTRKKRAVVLVHRLVAQAFIPNPYSHPVVNHMDSNVDNNAHSNLEWCTQKQNIQHAASNGRMKCCWKGGRGPTASLSEEQVLLIFNEVNAGLTSMAEIARKLSIGKTVVQRIMKRKTYKYVALPVPPEAGK